MSIAASITLIAVVFFGFGPTTISTQLGETSVYVLPDNSTVTLNADSKISFNKIKWFFNREVALEGEAFFKVTKGSDFTVTSEKGRVTVLGTTFNVNARPGTYEVSCFTGKVSVIAGDESIILTKGLHTRLEESGLSNAQPFDTEKSTWREGDFYFESARLADVINELERQFGVEIDFEGDSARTYTGYFSNKNLDAALAMVFKPMALTYTIQKDNKIVVK
jgi:transmembrane sensor